MLAGKQADLSKSNRHYYSALIYPLGDPGTDRSFWDQAPKAEFDWIFHSNLTFANESPLPPPSFSEMIKDILTYPLLLGGHQVDVYMVSSFVSLKGGVALTRSLSAAFKKVYPMMGALSLFPFDGTFGKFEVPE